MCAFAACCKHRAEQLGRPGNGETLSVVGPADATRKMQVEGLGIAAWERVGHVGNKMSKPPSFQRKRGGLEIKGLEPVGMVTNTP